MKRRRGQSLVEFALVLPILLLFIFGILDLGRGIVAYLEISQAVGEAARAAAIAPSSLPANADVLSAANTSLGFISLAQPCPNAAVPSNPSSAQLPAAGHAWLYIGNPAAAASTNADGANAPGGQSSTTGCTATPAHDQNGDRLQVTIVYNFQPVTPVISDIVGGQIVLTSTSVIAVEY